MMAASDQTLHSNTDTLSSLSIPGKRRLPSWKRPGLVRKTSLVGTLSRDKSVSPITLRDGAENVVLVQQRILQLEKNIHFLKDQHRDTLEQLHKEIERLKTENRELNFKLVMSRCGRSSGDRLEGEYPVSSGAKQHPVEGRPYLEEEVRALRASLAQERAKSRQLKTVIERKVLEQQRSLDQSDNDSSVGVQQSPLVGGASRPPTLAECEGLIKHLQETINKQSHELQQIKADLRDVLYSHKWTPDAFLLARAYVADNQDSLSDDRGVTNVGGLPKIPAARTMCERAYQRIREEVTLPALKPHVSNSFPDRQRRTQALRNKLGRSVP